MRTCTPDCVGSCNMEIIVQYLAKFQYIIGISVDIIVTPSITYSLGFFTHQGSNGKLTTREDPLLPTYYSNMYNRIALLIIYAATVVASKNCEADGLSRRHHWVLG